MATRRILLLGTGGIATHHVQEFADLPNVKIVACVDSVPGRADAFAARYHIAEAFPSLEAAIAWGDFEAAINCTPDAVHKPTTLALIAAGKHVFCEKPLAPNYPDAMEMTEAAEKAGLVNMVNLTYRNSPAVQEARAMVQAGEIGELRHVEAAYRQSWLVSKAWGDWRTDEKWLWRLSKAHGSTGVLGDVGVHILDFATYAAGDKIVTVKADLATFRKAEGDRIGDYRLDANDSFAMTGRMASGALATIVATRYATGHMNDLALALHGTKGSLKLETDGRKSKLWGCLGNDVEKFRWRKLELPQVKRNARRFADALASGVNGGLSFRRAAEMQQIIDAAFASDKSGKEIKLA
ncbi:MAG TPA: Gfo/Idh/MocA family oxidoreductase [Mesorhizobium sp.]